MTQKKAATKQAAPTAVAQQDTAAKPDNGKAEGPTLTGAVVHALKTLGHDAETTAVRTWITQNYPGIDVSAASFQSTLSLKRKEARGGSPAKSPGKKRGRKPGSANKAKPAALIATAPTPAPLVLAGGATAVVTAPEPTFSEMLRAKQAADGQGGVEGLLTTVQSVRVIAAQIGGVDKLVASLEALQKLGGGK